VAGKWRCARNVIAGPSFHPSERPRPKSSQLIDAESYELLATSTFGNLARPEPAGYVPS
jgi:hypothetical protein